MNITQHEFHGARREPRLVWIQKPLTRPLSGVCLLLDGEHYLEQVGVAPIIAKMQQDDRLPPMLVVYASSFADSLLRWTDSCCNEAFADHIATEMLPWLETEFGVVRSENILVGLSLTGLSAVHAALRHPGVFPRVLAQSGSFWWNDLWLTRHVSCTPGSRVAFRITVGADETQQDATHTHRGHELVQVTSQVDSNRMMRDALMAAGHQVSYCEQPGGHDFSGWRDGFEESLVELLSLPSTPDGLS